jgi:NAD+ synthase (glutamine-hydrolysing)
MTTQLKITLAQLNLHVGDIDGNLTKLISAANTARDTQHADVIVFPELAITGYPPEDLLFRPAFIAAAERSLQQIKEQVRHIYCVIGHPLMEDNKLYNACSVIFNGEILGCYKKQYLPNYSIFDEYRYFTPGSEPCVISIKDIPVGITICEDLWHDAPIKQAKAAGAKLILSPNASPFEIDKHEKREEILANRAKDTQLPIVYVNCIGGQDELVFDGGSMVVNADGNICQHAGFFNENLLTVNCIISENKMTFAENTFSLPSKEALIYQALVLGVRDYVQKNHFPGALIGVSGGIDSALVLAIAVDALGKDKVNAILMPSRYTSEMSMQDATEIVNNLAVEYQTISIEPAFKSYLESLNLNKQPGITEENIQSRCRGTIIMAISNSTGKIVLTTGNRSEMTVGYATLYGDMAGGLDVLKDIPKTLVYRLANYRNHLSAVIPQRIIDRPPSAELAPDQKDEDSLPPYPILDKILELYLNQELSSDDIIKQGFDATTVNKVINLIHKSEHKRRQAPIGIRVNHKAFGRDRRYPITSGFKD